MFQDFRRRTTPETVSPRLRAVRASMAVANVDAFLVPRADAHQGEHVAPRDDRLAWLTSFTGSAGLAVVAQDTAAIFVDGRYRLQVTLETDPACFTALRMPEDKLEDWLVATLPEGARVGFDPWLHTVREIETLREALEKKRIGLVVVDNPVDQAWTDQPDPPAQPIVPQPDSLAGRSSADKRQALAGDLAAKGLAAAVLTLPDSIAWLLNVRGSDIARTPVPLAFAILHDNAEVTLFTNPAKADATTRDHLGPGVTIAAVEAFGPALDALEGRIAVDRTSAPVWVSDRLAAAGASVVWERDPCILPKAKKTEAEIAGLRTAHHRDAVAMVEFLAWLDATAPDGRLTEIDVVRKLETIRGRNGDLRDISFETICGAGPDGAIIHYRVSETSNRPVRPGDVLLVDSGAQYVDGTTDITRTMAIGAVPAEAARFFTLVLKGLIAISRLRWPAGLAGRDIDAFARSALWSAGFDYDHGTGHGVGAYLDVHEGPQRLSRLSTEPLFPGMTITIEPGYYRVGVFGIRCENVAIVTEPAVPEGGERAMLGFDTLTLVPFDRRLIDPTLLVADELAWLDAYHRRVASEIGPELGSDAARWLAEACAPIRAT